MAQRYGQRGRVVGLALVLVALLAGSVAADPILDPLRDLVVHTAAKIVSKSLHGSLEVGSLRGSLLSAPTLYDIVLRDAQGEVVGQVAEIRLAYDLKTLLTKRLTVRQVDIIRPQLTLVQEPDGSVNLGRLFSAAPSDVKEAPAATAASGLPFALVIDNAYIQDGQLALRLPSLPGVHTVDSLQVHLQGQIDQGGVRATLHQLTMHAQPANVEIRSLRGGFQALADGVQVEDVRLQTANTLVTINGALPGKRQLANLEGHLQPLDVTEIGRLLHNDTLHGELRLTLHAEGPAEALTVQSQLSLGDGQIDLQGQVDTTLTSPRYTATVALHKVDVSAIIAQAAWQSDLNLRVRVEGEGLTPHDLRGQIALDLQPSRFGDIDLRPSQIHLEARSQRFQVQQFQLDTSVARMTATGALDLAAHSDVQYQLVADLSHLRQILGMPTLGGDLEVRGQVEGEAGALRTHGTLQAKSLQYQEHRLQALQLTYDGSRLQTQPQIAAHLVAQGAQVGTLPVAQLDLQATYQDEPRQVQFTTRVQQSATDSGSIRGVVTLLDTGQQIVLEEMEIRLADRLWRSTAPLEVALEAGKVAVQNFQLAHAEESLTFSGALAGEQLQEVRLHIQRLDLQALRRLLPLPALLGDRATVQVSLDGTLANPRLQGEVWLEPPAAPGQPPQRLHTTLSYQDQQFHSTVHLAQAQREVLTLMLQLPVDLALTQLAVAQRLREAPLVVRLDLKRPDLAALRHWVAGLPELTGTLQGEMTLQGMLPTLELDTDIQVQRLSMPGVIEELSTPLRLSASVVTAASLEALAQALSQGDIAVQVQKLAVRAPTIRAQFPGPEGPKPIVVDKLLVQADAGLTRSGLQVVLHNMQLQVVAFDLPRTDLTLAGRMTPQQFEVTRLHVRLPQSEVRLRGTLQNDGQRLQARVEIPRLRLDELALRLPPELPPEVQGTIDIQGSIPAPQVTARLQYATARVTAEAQAQWRETLPQYKVALQVEGFPIARLMPGTSGLFQARLQLQGRGFAGAQRHADADLQVASPDFALAPGLTTRVRARLAGDAVELTQLQVRSVPVAVEARGVLSAARQVDLNYTVTLGDLRALQDVLGVAMQAQGRLTGTVQGPLEALQTRATLRLDTWAVADFQGKSMQATFSATGLPASPKATFTARLPEVQGPSLTASTVDLQGAYQAPHGTFRVAVTAGPYEKTLLAGKVALQDDLHLTLERLRVQRHDLVWENAGPVEVRREAQGTLRLQQLVLRSGEQEISARATLSPDGTIDGAVRVQRLHILSNVQAFAPEATVPEGRIALDLAVRGALKHPVVDGTLALTALRWQGQEVGEVRAQLNMAGDVLRTDVRWQEQGHELLHVFGTVTTGASIALALQVQMPDLDMARLKSLSPAIVQSAGALTVDLHVTGTPQQPLVHGTMRWREGVLQLAATGERYKDIDVSVVFSGERLEVQRLQVGSRSGVLQIQGWLTSAGLVLQQLNMSIKAENFMAMHTPDIEAMLTGDVTVRGSLEKLEALGKITVPRARVKLTGKLGGGPATVEPWELTVEGVYGPGRDVVVQADGRTVVVHKQVPLPFLRVDLNVEIPRNTWVQGTGTAIEMRGNMRVAKAFNEPFVIDGTVETMRGFATFYGKKFIIQEGRVTFPGTEDINPFLEVLVTHAVSDYVVSIQVGGRAQQPTLTLSSVPELQQADIVSLLVMGKTSDRLTSSEQSALAGQAQQVLGGAVSSGLEQTLGKPLGLDTVEVEAGKEIGTGSVSVGRYVTQDLFLSYEKGFGNEGGNTMGIEYSINRRLKLKGSGSDTGESALDLLWRYDY